MMVCPPVGVVPPVYSLGHFLIGYASSYKPEIGWAFLAYELYQLLLGKRFFLLEDEVCPGNSVAHTLSKLAVFAVGWLVGHSLHG